MKKILIEPSLLSANFANLASEIKKCEEAEADLLHLDIMDGNFVPNITFGPFIVNAIRKITSLPLVCHLMIQNPDFYIPMFAESGANYISFHVEASKHINRTLELIKSFGIKAGIALNPGTPLEFAFENAEFSDFILLMSVNPGFGGQKFIPTFLQRCERLRNFLEKNKLDQVQIEVDGGIKYDNVLDVVKAGANLIVSGSGIFEGDVVQNIKNIKSQIQAYFSKLQT